MEKVNEIVGLIDTFVWGSVMLVLLVGTGIFLTIRLRFLPWRNLGYALHSVLSKEARTTKRGTGDVSPFSALMTALAATIGTGNIIGVATAMFAGGPGALVWMWISACFGLTSKFSECMLAIKYRETNEKGEMSGGPMYTMKNAFKNKAFGHSMGFLFALFTVLASFGIGNMTQANSISGSLTETFGVPSWITGIALTVLALIIILGGITSISKVSSVVVPVMAIFYVIAGLIVICGNITNVPHGLYLIFGMAFHPQAIGGGVLGTITVSVMNSLRYGVARGVFSNEAGLGSAAITAAAATTDDPVRQGYINMTGTFFDTIVVCTITGLSIAASGVLGTTNAAGEPLQGIQLTMAAFGSVLGPVGSYLVAIGIILFAFSTILGWEYHGEKAFEYLFKSHRFNIIYRVIFSLVVYVGATQTLDLVWNISDIMNALMAIPNLICILLLSNVVASEVKRFQPTIAKEKAERKAARATNSADAVGI
ncbi:sodium:alanine symporter family protein [[Clostridium] scindens]|uniref:alanine/glycine:cation symporter family protein n=1 Tax=Clostridium scindens (strain JCM 10418 / VPI 12708) TaxID=29347 RepID=UPI001D07AD17|nr:sodium:alanine symporter family protein [[Clostridium] scindens]MCB6645850.1 sodium:alanine symporter family protein [[Clostridium] scindens]